MTPGSNEYSRRQFLTWLGAVTLAAPVLNALGSTRALASQDITVLTGATVIDGTGTPARSDHSVVLIGERIAWVGPTAQMPPPAPEAHVIDMAGKYVLPGLLDMHTHFGYDEWVFVPLYIANGVTTVREMWGFPEIHAVRDRIELGQLFGPHFFIASNLIDGAHSFWAPDATQAVTEEDGRQAARTAVDGGADFIKVYAFLLDEAYGGLVDEATRLGIPFAGHAGMRLFYRKQIDAGQRSFEHLDSLSIATSTYEHKYLRTLNDTPIDPSNPRLFIRLFRQLEREGSLTHNAGKAAALFERMVLQDAWQCPTLHVNKVVMSPPETFADDPRVKYIYPGFKQFWDASLRAVTWTPERVAQQAAFFEFKLDLVGRMAAAGVGILGGTDAGNPYVLPGFSAHDELALLVEAGLSPMRALMSMTGDAARYLDQDHDIGTVRTGRYADLLVLNADPIANIGNTQNIHAIFVRGRHITAEDRQQMLDGIEAFTSQFLAASSTAGGSLPAAALPSARGMCACHA